MYTCENEHCVVYWGRTCVESTRTVEETRSLLRMFQLVPQCQTRVATWTSSLAAVEVCYQIREYCTYSYMECSMCTCCLQYRTHDVVYICITHCKNSPVFIYLICTTNACVTIHAANIQIYLYSVMLMGLSAHPIHISLGMSH